MHETSGPESPNSCDHFSYFKPLNTRRLPSHQPGTPEPGPGALSMGLAGPAGFFKESEFNFLATQLVPDTVPVFSIHCLICCHPYVYAERSVVHR